MNSKERADILQLIRQEMEATLNRLLTAKGVTESNQRIVVTFHFKGKPKTSLADMAKAEKPELPKDNKGGGICFETWHLSKEDWAKFDALKWPDSLRKAYDTLRASNNGPVHISDLASNGVRWNSQLTMQFNTVLSRASNYKIGREGAYYGLAQLTGRRRAGWYAISRYGYPEKR